MKPSRAIEALSKSLTWTPRLAKPLLAKPLLAFATLAVTAFAASAQDRADIDRTQIIGNRELPKVIYIVPWKKPLPGEMSGRPIASVLDEALAPVDRDVFRRELRYHGQLATNKPLPASPPQEKKP